MASQPSVYNEERNLLRLRAREQRNQETSQSQELNPENVPLFGEPYKTNKGDELSNRIQRMLGSYEDVNNPCHFSIEALPIPTCVSFSQSDQGQLNADKSSKTPFHSQALYMSTQSQKEMSSNAYSSQPMRTSSTASPSNHHGSSSTFSETFLNHSQGSQFIHSAHQQKSEVFSDLREHVSLPQSPDAKPLSLPHSSDHNMDMDSSDSFDKHQLQGSADYPLGSASSMDVSTLNMKQSPKDPSLPQAKTSTLPSQTFPSLLLSKQPGIVMTQKPTAYVRPMDGQDQVASESPELKPSSEHYVPIPEVPNKSDSGKMKITPQYFETTTEEAQCVEDILREMTQSLPPPLTPIHTPSSDEPPKSTFPAKKAEHVSSCPGQRQDSSPADPSHFSQQSSSTSFEAHSSDVETTSSSDSESSLGSESDSESTAEDPPQPPEGSSTKTEPDASAVSNGDWQLGKWIRPSQQNSGADSRGGALMPGSPTQKQLLPTQSSKQTTEEPKPWFSSHQRELTDALALADPHQFSESLQDNGGSADVSSCGSSRKLWKQAMAGCPDPSDAALGVKCEEVATTQTKAPCFTDRPKVKTKTGHRKKDANGAKKDIKRTKHTKPDKLKGGSEATVVLYGHCPSCGVHDPNPCSCSAQSPAQPAPTVRFSCSKPKAEPVCQSGTKMPHKSTQKHSETSGHAAKGSLDLCRPRRSLLVKIDLSLLSRVPHTSSIHKGIPSNAKRPALVLEQDEEGRDVSKTHKQTTAGKKPRNVEVENKTLPKKKQKLKNNNTSSAKALMKPENSSNPAEVRKQKKAKKHVQDPTKSKDAAKDAQLEKCDLGKTLEPSKEAVKSKDSHKGKKSSGKRTQHPRHQKSQQKPPKSSLAAPSTSQPHRDALTNRPMLRFDERQYPVKHYIKEAKRLKHKADAESDKLSKAFTYLDAAMFFVQSGIAMEKDPQISVSSYTMFAETVELLKFILKLRSPVDSTATPSEKDLLALCLKCQSLLQMAMFRHKQKMALKYSKTLIDHFNNSAQASHNPPLCSSKIAANQSPNVPSPAISGPSSNHSTGGLGVGPFGPTVTIPQEIEQVAFTYVNITSLVLSAHDMWEQAEVLAHKGSGMLAELDTVLGPLSLTSSMSSVVCYTRQGVHWLRLDSPKV
ncbi:AF4/FMR2 family member 1 isoform X2 [Leuresthes tenuis]|uniref:AF4/FMR2 family member 1 isoform X2 n=1 Tax=Leuresthes tenuis TaxID=355514 RepID=UPI003B50F908